MSNNYKEDLQIDENNLEYEWKRQASLYEEWGEKAANAHFEKDKKQEKLALIKAKLDTEYRKKLKEDKPKEAEILSNVLQDPRYMEASNDYLEAYKTAKVLDVAEKAFDHRKRALENLTKLFLNNYYAEPYVPKRASEAVHSQTRNEINNVLKKGTKNEIKPSLRKRND